MDDPPKTSRFRFSFLRSQMERVKTPYILSANSSPKAVRQPRRTRNMSLNASGLSVLNTSRNFDAQPKLNFYRKYKKYYKRSVPITSREKSDSSEISYIKALERHRLMPETCAFVRKSAKEICAPDLGLGDKYASALAFGLEHQSSEIEILNLKGNRLTGQGAANLLTHIDPLVISFIDLSYNHLGILAVEKLRGLLEQTSTLTRLSLEQCNMSPSSLRILCRGLELNISITSLNLSHNNINDDHLTSLAPVLRDHQIIKSIDLNYNSIRGIGGALIFNAVRENTALLDLNLAWNSMGGQKHSSAEAFAEAMFNNEVLRHLDVSFNRFTYDEIEQVGAQLRFNHTLMGLHVQGNQATYDPKGYLTPSHNKQTSQDLVLANRRGATSSNCWICERWRQLKVAWSPKEMGWSGRFLEKFSLRSKKVEPVYMHLFVDEWVPSVMPRSEATNEYEVVRAVPCTPGLPPTFFISHRGQPKISSRYDMTNIDQPISKEMQFTETSVATLSVMVVQTAEVYGEPFDLYGHFDAIPRYDSEIEKPEIVREISVWTLEKSFFKDMLVKPETYDKCLTTDISQSRIKQIFKDSEQFAEVQTHVRAHYPQLIEVYKHFATSQNIKTDNVFLNYTELLHFLTVTNIVDERSFRKVDYDVIFKAVNFNESGEQELNPTHGVVRYEFIETIVRVAIEKFRVKGTASSDAEAVRILLYEVLATKMPNFDGNLWRRSRYFTENMEIVFKTYMPVFQRLYDKYKDTKGKIGAQAYIDQDRFMSICDDLGLGGGRLGHKSAFSSFHKAMLPQTDEITNSRHLKMSFMEFLEALSRAIDLCTELPLQANVHKHWYIEELEIAQWTLDMKVEAMVPTIISCLNQREADKVRKEVQLDITTDIRFVKEHDMSNYKL